MHAAANNTDGLSQGSSFVNSVTSDEKNVKRMHREGLHGEPALV